MCSSVTLCISPITALWQASDVAFLAGLTSTTSISLPTASSTATTTTQQSSTLASSTENNFGGISLGAEIGIAIGVAVGLIVIFAAVITLCRIRLRKGAAAPPAHDALAELHVEEPELKVYQLTGKSIPPELEPTTSPGPGTRLPELEGGVAVAGGCWVAFV